MIYCFAAKVFFSGRSLFYADSALRDFQKMDGTLWSVNSTPIAELCGSIGVIRFMMDDYMHTCCVFGEKSWVTGLADTGTNMIPGAGLGGGKVKQEL